MEKIVELTESDLGAVAGGDQSREDLLREIEAQYPAQDAVAVLAPVGS